MLHSLRASASRQLVIIFFCILMALLQWTKRVLFKINKVQWVFQSGGFIVGFRQVYQPFNQ